MIICCDMDCVLNDLVPKILTMYNKQSGKSIVMEDLTSYSFHDCLNKEDADSLTRLFKVKALWDSLSPIKGAKEGLQKLIDAGNRVFIATATAPENLPWKIQWIKKHFPFFNPDNVIRIMDKSVLKTDILIEDNMDQLVNHKLCHRICLNYPWNQHGEDKDFVYNIHRCNSWTEILEAINNIKEEINKV